MKDIINGFREYQIKLNKSEKTIKAYVKEAELFIRNYNINSIEDFKILEDTDFLTDVWLVDMTKQFAIGTVNKKKASLSVFSSYLLLQDIIKENKIKQIENLKNDNSKIEIYTNEDIERIFDYMKNKIDDNQFQRHIDKTVYFTNMVAIKLMSSCALRVDELCSIQMNDLNMETRKLNIRGKCGHGNVTRFNKLNKEMAELVKQYLEIRSEIKIKEGNEQYLFISAISKAKISDASIRKFIKKILDELDIITSSPCHAFRHQRASELIAKGANVKAVSLYLGHSSEKVTEQYYIHQDEEVMEDLCEL